MASPYRTVRIEREIVDVKHNLEAADDALDDNCPIDALGWNGLAFVALLDTIKMIEERDTEDE